jgi:hypothetical protein
MTKAKPKKGSTVNNAPAVLTGPSVVMSDPPSAEPIKAVPVPDAPETVDSTLVKILSWKRSHGSASEGEFLSWLHSEIKARGHKSDVKAQGCITVTVLMPENKASTTLFSCHVDTVDDGESAAPQSVVYDPSFGHIFLDKNDANAGTCLGADDGAGVWPTCRAPTCFTEARSAGVLARGPCSRRSSRGWSSSRRRSRSIGRTTSRR